MLDNVAQNTVKHQSKYGRRMCNRHVAQKSLAQNIVKHQCKCGRRMCDIHVAQKMWHKTSQSTNESVVEDCVIEVWHKNVAQSIIRHQHFKDINTW